MKNLTFAIALFFTSSFISVSSYAEEGTIRLSNNAYKQVITKDKDGNKKIDYVEPKIAVPGDVIFYSTTFENIGNDFAENIVINNPIPNNSKYREGSAEGKDTKIEFSIDGGKTFGLPEKLIVKDKSGKTWTAKPEDYTDIRWIYQKPLAPADKGSVSFKTMIKKPGE